jgi:hypothetical protein
MRRFRDSRKAGAESRLPRPFAFARPEPFVNRMSRRNIPGPAFEIVPRDRPLQRPDLRASHESAHAQQLGPRLRKLYSPCATEHPEDIRMLIVALDHKLQKQ